MKNKDDDSGPGGLPLLSKAELDALTARWYEQLTTVVALIYQMQIKGATDLEEAAEETLEMLEVLRGALEA